MSKKKPLTKKTTAASERAARESRKPAPRKSKAAKQALDSAAALKRNAIAADPASSPSETREAEILKARSLGIELEENEFLTRPDEVPEGFEVIESHSRGGVLLKQPIYVLQYRREEPKKPSEVLDTKRKKGGSKKEETTRVKAWAQKEVKDDRAKPLLDKLKKGTRGKPILAAKQLSDSERALARRLFALGQIKRDKFDQGIGYFA
jgi:hypothetical protein